MTTPKELNQATKDKAEHWRTLRDQVLTVLGIMLAPLMLLGLLSALYFIYTENAEQIDKLIQGKATNDVIVYIVSWVILLIISFMATLSVREIIRERSQDLLRKRANYIAIMIGLVLIIFLFKQPYLDKLFKGHDAAFWLRSLLLTGGATAGWSIWYLRQLEKYGEFFNVFLFTVVTGFCWYARLTAPEQVQLTTVAFLLGSLFRVAKDYLDEAAKKETKS